MADQLRNPRALRGDVFTGIGKAGRDLGLAQRTVRQAVERGAPGVRVRGVEAATRPAMSAPGSRRTVSRGGSRSSSRASTPRSRLVRQAREH
jgi:hypothetical protein